MAEQGSYPLDGRTLSSTDNVTGVVAGQTADVPLSVLSAFILSGVSGGGSGPTSGRPFPPAFVGQGYFDTTLGFMVWASLIVPPTWVDAAGVVV